MRRQERRVVAVVFLRSLKKDGFFVIKRKNARKSPVKSKKAARNKQKSPNKTKQFQKTFKRKLLKISRKIPEVNKTWLKNFR